MMFSAIFRFLLPKADPPAPDEASVPMHVEQLIGAASEAEMASWLLACPLMLLAKNATEIRWKLKKERFELGISYLAVEISTLHARRNSNGYHTRSTRRLVQQMRSELSVVAQGGGL